MRALFLCGFRLEVSNFLPHLSVGAVVVVLVGVFQLDRIAEFQNSLLQTNAHILGMVQQQFELDPFTNTLFLFCGRRRDRIKGLYWEKDGFILLYKRLEQGAYQWPRSEFGVRSLTPQQYRLIMEGLKIEQPKAHRPVAGLSVL